jgi:hypothetical protein
LVATRPAIPTGVKPVLDYEVLDVGALYEAQPHLVLLNVKRKETLAALKKMQDLGVKLEIPGLKIFEIFTVNKR